MAYYKKIRVVESDYNLPQSQNTLFISWCRPRQKSSKIICLTSYVESHRLVIFEKYAREIERAFKNIYFDEFKNILINSRVAQCSALHTPEIENYFKFLAFKMIIDSKGKHISAQDIYVGEEFSRYDISKYRKLNLKGLIKCGIYYLKGVLYLTYKTYLFLIIKARDLSRLKSLARDRSDYIFVGYGCNYTDCSSPESSYWKGLRSFLRDSSIPAVFIDIPIRRKTDFKRYIASNDSMVIDNFLGPEDFLKAFCFLSVNFFELFIKYLSKDFGISVNNLAKSVFESGFGKTAAENFLFDRAFADVVSFAEVRKSDVIYLLEGQNWEATLIRHFRRRLDSNGNRIIGYVHSVLSDWDFRLKALERYQGINSFPHQILVNSRASELVLNNAFSQIETVQVESLRHIGRQRALKKPPSFNQDFLLLGDYLAVELFYAVNIVEAYLKANPDSKFRFFIREHPLAIKNIGKMLSSSRLSVLKGELKYRQFLGAVCSATSSVSLELIDNQLPVCLIVPPCGFFKPVVKGAGVFSCSDVEELQEFLSACALRTGDAELQAGGAFFGDNKLSNWKRYLTMNRELRFDRS